MRVAIIGSGYVGLVTGVCLAAKAHDVVCVDINRETVENINRGVPPIFESGLPELLRDVLDRQKFRATVSLTEALEKASLVLVAVGTPSENGRISLRYIEDAVGQIGREIRRLNRFLSVVIKSTVIPGTTDTVVRKILEQSSGRTVGDVGLGMNPEFLKEGDAVEDFLCPDRIVYGAEDERTLALLEELYQPWSCEKVRVNSRTAEFTKYMSNTMLALQISASNELANLAAQVGNIDIMEAIRGVSLDKRWSPLLADGKRVHPDILSYLIPGCGFGGSCFPKDVQALRTQGTDAGLPMRMLQAVLDTNEEQPFQVVRMLRKQLGALNRVTFLVLGLAFKPGTDDLRESASYKIISGLRKEGAVVIAHDPVAVPNARKAWADLECTFVEQWEEHLDGVAGVVIATRWQEYRRLVEPERASNLRGKIVMDPRHLFRAEEFPHSVYLSIGVRKN